MQATNNSNFILTGATGVLGSHIFYELLLKIHQNNYRGNLILLLRSKNKKSYFERFEDLFNEELVPDYLRKIDLLRIRRNNIKLIDIDLKNLSNAKDLIPSNSEKYHLIHCAASVNLGNNQSAFDDIKYTNYLGTLNLIQTLLPVIFKVSYISTAFAYRPEEVKRLNLAEYRNHYEKFKAQIEEEIVQICDGYGLQSQILRPSIICGRLIDYPHHVICRFLVFYLFGAFFFHTKNTYNNTHIRIAINSNAGLNMVPSDYAAKAIVRALNTDIKELNIVSKKYLPNTYTIPIMLKGIGWYNYEFVDRIPGDQNSIEKLYYRTAGSQLSQYLLASDYDFDMAQLNSLMEGIEEPDVYKAFPELCQYAIDKEFNHVLA